MYKPISVPAHGIIDYTYAAVVPRIPELAGFKNEDAPRLVCRTLGAGALTYTLLTDAKWGFVKAIPFRAHLLLDCRQVHLRSYPPGCLAFKKRKRHVTLYLSLERSVCWHPS